MTQKKSNSPIGIFDSGIGGLTVAKEIIRKLPGENIIYLGDTARVPYGTKSSRTVITYSERNTEFLVSKDIKLLVVACNTASSVSLPTLRSKYDIPVLGVITPGAKKAASTTITNKVGVIGTPSTINSGAYEKALKEITPGISVISKACPLFVALADEGWTDREVSELVAREYLENLRSSGIDVLVLGCTHYPLLKPVIRKVMGAQITLVDSAEETANEVYKALSNMAILNDNEAGSKKEFYLSDVSETFLSVAGNFLGESIDNIEMVDIPGTASS